jgi:hypothetical protein
MKKATGMPKTREFKTLEDLIAYDGSEMPDEKSRVLAKITANNGAMEILLLRTNELIEEYQRLTQ